MGDAPKPDAKQIDKFRDAARQLGTDDDPERFAATVKKLGKAKPIPADKPNSKKEPVER
jgi:hypothetical protein